MADLICGSAAMSDSVPPAVPPAVAPTPAAAPARAQIRLSAQLLTCLAMCLIATAILFIAHDDPMRVLAGPMSLTRQLMIGQGLALLAAAGAYLQYRLMAGSEVVARTARSYARLDLRGLNPLWMSIAAAVGEEALFRAALQPLLGVWLTSLVFLVTHTPAYRFRQPDRATLLQAAGVFGASVALGFVFQYVGLLAAIMVHAWIDIVGLLVVRAIARKA
jgi:membrane protease YdiL (CAAX protease family)